MYWVLFTQNGSALMTEVAFWGWNNDKELQSIGCFLEKMILIPSTHMVAQSNM